MSWGSNQRGALGVGSDNTAITTPTRMPPVEETITVYDKFGESSLLSREPKFTTVVSGLYHTLFVSGNTKDMYITFFKSYNNYKMIIKRIESHQVFATGDSSYGALGRRKSKDQFVPHPVDLFEKGDIVHIQAGRFTSYALVGLLNN